MTLPRLFAWFLVVVGVVDIVGGAIGVAAAAWHRDAEGGATFAVFVLVGVGCLVLGRNRLRRIADTSGLRRTA